MSERPCVYSGRDGKHYGADRDPRTVAANDWNSEFEGPEIDYEKTSDQMSADVQPGSEESNEDYDNSDEEVVTDGGREAGTLAAVSHTLNGEVSVQKTMERGPETGEDYETVADGGVSGMPDAGFSSSPSYDEKDRETESMSEHPM